MQFGIGLRDNHYQYIIDNNPAIDWLEIISENYFDLEPAEIYALDKISERYPIVMHGVSLNIGSCDELDFDYLAKLNQLKLRVNPKWLSDHLCWTGINKINTHDLLPLPYNDAVIEHVVSRLKIVQDHLEVKMLLENPSSYLQVPTSTMPEWQCLNYIADLADCYILLDVNNVFVSSFNHKFDPYEYIKNINHNRVKQIHLAGHTNHGEVIIDTHDSAVIPEVWDLYQFAIKCCGPTATMIERDANMPEFGELLAELEIAKQRSLTEEMA